MSKISLDHNLGLLDRVLRGVLGLSLIMRGASQQRVLSPWMVLGGSMLLIPSLTGTDPLLKAFGLSTKAQDENFFMNMMKQVKPGYGVPPLQTQQASPNREFLQRTHFTGKTLADALSVG
jgi:hypothetical protein